MNTKPLSVIIVEKTGLLKQYNIKDFKENELYKKCGFKKSDGFNKQPDWTIKYDGKKYIISMYGKLDGKANTENKYDFPPPIDNKLFFGNCMIVAKIKDDQNTTKLTSLTIPLWDKLYEKLFGGFEDLTSPIEDDAELDELDNISISKKTKNGGYLKDGFVVDSDDDDEACSDSDNDSESDTIHESVQEEPEDVLNLVDIGSELSEEMYEYSDNE